MAIWQYARVLLALPFLSGIVFMVFAFVPLTDDAGNLIEISLLKQCLIFLVGFVMTCLVPIIAVPGLIKSSKRTQSMEV